MTTVAEATEALRAAVVAGVPTVFQVVTNQITKADPPCVVIGLPTLVWEAFCSEPTSAQFRVALVLGVNEQATENLQALVLSVAAALDEVTDANVLRAEPGLWQGTLPSYEILTEVSL